MHQKHVFYELALSTIDTLLYTVIILSKFNNYTLTIIQELRGESYPPEVQKLPNVILRQIPSGTAILVLQQFNSNSLRN